MDDLSRKFILLQDRVGTNVERSLLSLGLSTKQVPTQVLRGELLEALPEAEQPQDSLKIALGSIERKSLRLECALDCLMRLTEEEANLLLAISSREERYQTYMDRIRLDFGKKIELGSRVFVTVKGFPKKLPGVVWYKGDLSPGSGTMFGVELIEHPGRGTSDGASRNHQYFSCPPDSGVFVGLDKLTPQVDSEAKSTKKGESHQSTVVSRVKESIIPSSWKGKNEPDLYQGDVECALKPDQRVVTFLDDKHPIRGSVRFIGKDKDRHGKTYTVVGLELDTRDGNCNGKLHGRQVFVCRRDFGVFIPIGAVIPEENFDASPAKLQTRKQSEKGDNVQEQIRSDEELARSTSCNHGNSAGQGSMPTKGKRANSVEEPASVTKAAGESSKTDPTEFIEQQRQQLKMLEMKRSKLSAHNYEDVDIQDDERTDSATKLSFDDTHFEQTLPNSTQRDNILITEQPCLSGVIPTKSYADFVHIEQWEYEEVIKQHEARNATVTHPGPRLDSNTRPPSAKYEDVSDSSPGTEALPSHFGERPRPQPSFQEHARANVSRHLGQTEEQKDSVQRELMRTKEDLENCQKQLRERDEQLREKEKEQANSQRQLSEIEQRLTHCQEQLQEREAGLMILLDQLREKEQQQENSSRQLTDMEQRLANCQEQLQEREAGLLEQLREKEQQKENSQTQLNEMEQRLTNYQEQLQEREAGLLEQLREKEQQQENSQTQLNEMEQRLANFERHISENEAGKANLERQLGVKDQELNELETSLSAAQQTISELRRQETCDWVIARDEIQIKEKCLGKGGWGSVNEGTYCGCVVAVKQIHELILSPHNRRLFEREMNIASRCRHPCLLQFIGATNDEGSPLFVTELMETSLRALLEQRELSEAEICVISLDVARALNYLHQRRPSPILHRDVSSANVLLWRQGDQWRGKVSDYGTAKFVQQTMTVAPGALIYSSPEAISSNQTAMVDVYSFGVLLCEMCIRELPDPERRDEQVVLVSNRVFRGLVRRCLETDPTVRPNMAQIMQELEQFNDTRS